MSTESLKRTAVSAADAPAAIGPYSQAIAYDGLLYCSGALPIDPTADALVEGSAGVQAEQCLRNLAAVCRSAGTELARAVRVTVYTTRLEDFAAINEAYGAFFDAVPPSRVTIGAAALPKGAAVEIDAVVALG